MKKRKKIKIYYGNLFLVIILIAVLGTCTYYLYKHFISDDIKLEENENKDNISEEESDKLSDLGYSKDEINIINSCLSDSDIENISKKYEYLSELCKEKYFHIENIERYEKLKDNSNYSNNEIIMRVNTSIDQEFYTNIKTIEDQDDLLVLVNKYYALDNDFEPKDLINVGNGQYMRREAGEQMIKLLEDINNEGLYLQAQSGYRSIETQRTIYNRWVNNRGQEYADTISARPTHSEHHTGLAMDLSHDGTLEKSFEDTPQFKWLEENAYKYGFIMRYPSDKIYMTGYDYEPWHYRYVGVEVASIIRAEGITFEEYAVKYLGLY